MAPLSRYQHRAACPSALPPPQPEMFKIDGAREYRRQVCRAAMCSLMLARQLLLRGPSQQTVASLCPKGSDHRLAISPVRETMARATRRVVGVLRPVFRLVAGLAVTCSRSSHALAFGRRGLIANLPWRWTGRRSNCCLRGVFGLSCRWRWVGRKRFQAPSTAQTSLAAARPLRAKKAAARGRSALALLRAPARALCLARYLW